MVKGSVVTGVERVLRRSEHVALHKVVITAELVEVHGGGSDHPDVSVREAMAQHVGHLLQTPANPLGCIRLQSHLILEVLHATKHHFYTVAHTNKILQQNIT